MKILQIIPSISPLTGGPSKSVPALCKSLAKLGHVVELWATDYWAEANEGREGGTQHSDGYKTVIWAHKNTIFAPGMPSSKQLVNTLKDKCLKFDIVHVHSFWNPVATFSMNLLRKKGMPYCLSPRGVLDPVVLTRNRWKKLPWMWLWDRANVEGAALIHFTTDEEERKARKSGWRLRRTVVVPNILDLDEWNALPSRNIFEIKFPHVKGREVIIFVGRINWVKNLDLLIKALLQVHEKRPLAMLVCVGPDNDGYQTQLLKLADSLGIKEDILFTGMLYGDELKAAFSRAQVFALVSKKENFGLAAAEALASGLPVVLSDGVDMGKDWPSFGPISRVRQDPTDIALGLLSMLARATSIVNRDEEARAIAVQHWGYFTSEKLVEGYRAIIRQ